MVQRFYFDTSVFGGMFDAEFEEDTTLLFEKVTLGQMICAYSELTESELASVPNWVQQHFLNIAAKHGELIKISPEALKLAQTYIEEKVVGETSLDDYIHIAIATISKFDMLVSWNFKHIVNVYRIRGYNSVNLRLGYSTLEIRSPKDIVGNENDR